jgi:ferredoxin/flavodoxin
MRACIIYFSQTGNTRKIAEAIQETMVGQAGHCDMLSMEEAGPVILDRYDLVGLGFPAFYFREPLNVTKYLSELPSQLKNGKEKPFFFFMTHGGTPGGAFFRIHRLASSCGLATMGFFECLGVDTYPPFSQRDPLSGLGHPDENDLAAARTFADGVIHNTMLFLNGSGWKRPDIPKKIFTRLAGGLFTEATIHNLMRLGFLPTKNVNQNKCTKCGLCAENCPVKVISLSPFPTIEEGKCIACYYCQRICPENAIECNWSAMRFITGESIRTADKK